LYAEYSFLPELKLRSSISLDNNDEYENNYNNTLISAGIATGGQASSYETKNTVFINEQVLTYIKSFGLDRKQRGENRKDDSLLADVLDSHPGFSYAFFCRRC